MTVKRVTAEKGFTLVELAIALTVIGLMIAGILKGQEMLINSRVTATLAQVKAIEAATTTFRDTYSSLPGDMANASVKVLGCGPVGVNCDAAAAAGGGNARVGPGWDLAAWQSASFLAPATTEVQETVLFWLQLNLAGLLRGTTMDGITNVTASWGRSLPAARIGGGFLVGTSSTVLAIPGPRPVPGGPSGLILVLTNTLGAPLNANVGGQLLTPSQAARLDRKVDDAKPDSGIVQTYGVTTSCYGNGPVWAYAESVDSRDCGLYFMIQG